MARKSIPRIVPPIVPLPPLKLAPPIITIVITRNSIPIPKPVLALIYCDAVIIPAIPARIELRT